MSFLSTKTLRNRLLKDNIITDFNPERIESAAYELSMGKEAYVTTDEKKKKYGKGDQIVIKPGQFAVLLTEETLKIPIDLIAFISIKFSIKFQGLVNVSGFHVDPGFEGKLKFSVYNAGSKPVVIDSGAPTFQIWFSKLDNSDELNEYNGDHKGQTDITAKNVMDIHGNIASPDVLKKRIDDIENELKIWRAVGYGLVVPFVIFLLTALLTVGIDVIKKLAEGIL